MGVMTTLPIGLRPSTKEEVSWLKAPTPKDEIQTWLQRAWLWPTDHRRVHIGATSQDLHIGSYTGVLKNLSESYLRSCH